MLTHKRKDNSSATHVLFTLFDFKKIVNTQMNVPQ